MFYRRLLTGIHRRNTLFSWTLMITYLISANTAQASIEISYHGNSNHHAMSAVHRAIEDFVSGGGMILSISYKARANWAEFCIDLKEDTDEPDLARTVEASLRSLWASHIGHPREELAPGSVLIRSEVIAGSCQ